MRRISLISPTEFEAPVLVEAYEIRAAAEHAKADISGALKIEADKVLARFNSNFSRSTISGHIGQALTLVVHQAYREWTVKSIEEVIGRPLTHPAPQVSHEPSSLQPGPPRVRPPQSGLQGLPQNPQHPVSIPVPIQPSSRRLPQDVAPGKYSRETTPPDCVLTRDKSRKHQSKLRRAARRAHVPTLTVAHPDSAAAVLPVDESPKPPTYF